MSILDGEDGLDEAAWDRAMERVPSPTRASLRCLGCGRVATTLRACPGCGSVEGYGPRSATIPPPAPDAPDEPSDAPASRDARLAGVLRLTLRLAFERRAAAAAVLAARPHARCCTRCGAPGHMRNRCAAPTHIARAYVASLRTPARAVEGRLNPQAEAATLSTHERAHIACACPGHDETAVDTAAIGRWIERGCALHASPRRGARAAIDRMLAGIAAREADA